MASDGWGTAAGGWAAPAPGGWGSKGGKGGKGGAKGGPPSTTVCVVNLPDTISPREFRFIFKFAAGVERCIVNHTKNGHQVGYARFSTIQDANAALEYLNGYPLDEEFPQTIKAFLSTTQLNDALPSQGRGQKRSMGDDWGERPAKMAKGSGGKGFGGKGFGGGKGKGGVTNPTSVYVGGVPHDWDETMLQKLFEPSGVITKVQLNRGKNPVGNIAFVHYATPEEAQAAITNMNSYAIDESRYLSVRGNTSTILTA